MNNKTEQPNIYACLALAEPNNNVEINWAGHDFWKNFKQFNSASSFNSITLSEYKGPYYTRTRKKSIVDEVVEKIRKRCQPSGVYSMAIREILQGYKIEKSDSADLAHTEEKLDSTPECEHDFDDNQRCKKCNYDLFYPEVKKGLKLVVKTKQSKLEEVIRGLRQIIIDANTKDGICIPYDEIETFLSKYITEPAKGIDDINEQLQRVLRLQHFISLGDKKDTLEFETLLKKFNTEKDYLLEIIKHWPKKVDHEKVANALFNRELSEKQYAEILKESYGEL